MTESGRDVLDASVVLAAWRRERSELDLLKLIDGCVLSAVNFGEVLVKATEFGMEEDPALKALLDLAEKIEPFTESRARQAAHLRLATRAQGLSFGDRACLALGMELGAVVYTAERRWAELSLPCEIRLIR